MGDDGDGVGVHGDGVPAVVQVVMTSRTEEAGFERSVLPPSFQWMMWWAWRCRGPSAADAAAVAGDQRRPLGRGCPASFFVRGRGDEGAFAFGSEDHRAHRRARQQIKRTGAQGVPSTRSRCHWWAGSPGPRGWTPRTPRRGGCLAAAALDMSVRASARRWAGVVVSWVSGGGVNDARFGPGSPRRPRRASR